MQVYVQNKDGKALMPCSPKKARKLLQEKKARIVSYEPMTIRLEYGSSGYVQKVVLGMDTGKKHAAYTAITEKGKILYQVEVELRGDVKTNLLARAQLRRSRRSRNKRHREPRFSNRKRKKGSLPPSIQAKINAQYKVAEKISEILPINRIRVEVGQFDVQAIENPEIEGKMYQEGPLQGWDHIREYILLRDKFCCHYAKLRPEIPCEGRLEVDHIIPRSKGGTNRVINLVCSCKAHNQAKGNLSYKNFTGKKQPRIKQFQGATFMNVTKSHLFPALQNLAHTNYTYGFITRIERKRLKLEKSHINDSIAITGIKPSKYKGNLFFLRQVRKKKRSLHEQQPRKGRKNKNTQAKRNSKNTKCVFHKGLKWCLWDKVFIESLGVGYISGFTGKSAYIQDIKGHYLTLSPKYKQISLSKLKLLSRNNNWIFQEID